MLGWTRLLKGTDGQILLSRFWKLHSNQSIIPFEGEFYKTTQKNKQLLLKSYKHSVWSILGGKVWKVTQLISAYIKTYLTTLALAHCFKFLILNTFREEHACLAFFRTANVFIYLALLFFINIVYLHKVYCKIYFSLFIWFCLFFTSLLMMCVALLLLLFFSVCLLFLFF